MIKYICVLLVNLALGHLNYVGINDLEGVPLRNTDPSYDYYYLSIVQLFTLNTRVKPSETSEIKYCRKLYENDTWKFYSSDLAETINFYNSLEYVYSHKLETDPKNPVYAYGAMQAKDFTLPVYISANILSRHIKNRFHPLRPLIGKQMQLMGRLDSDKQEYLLSLSIGGSNELWNVAPMARNIIDYDDCSNEKNTLGLPITYWRCNEDWIKRFLGLYKYGRVEWNIAVHYPRDTILQPEKYSSFRPESFTLQYTAFTERDNNDSLYYVSPPLTYLNDNEMPCGKSQLPSSIDWRKDNHDVYNLKNLNVTYPDQPKGLLGSETSAGEWNFRYSVFFPFNIEEDHFFYAQSILDGHRWFIQRLLPDGYLGAETDSGYFDNSFSVAFPYTINGSHYFYMHSTHTKEWVIQQLFPRGVIGIQTDKGAWRNSYKVSFPFTIDGKYYFYGQSIIDGNHWFIQELLADGKMGPETDSGTWKYEYEISFSYTIDGRVYFYGHSLEGFNWFIQELLPGGRMGRETSHGIWYKEMAIIVPFAIDGKQYMYGHGFENRHWFIRELSPGGLVGWETDAGFREYNYPYSFTYSIMGKHYLFCHCTDHYTWFVQELL